MTPDKEEFDSREHLSLADIVIYDATDPKMISVCKKQSNTD